MFTFERFNDNDRTPARAGINKPVFTCGSITHKNSTSPMRIMLFAGTLLAICLFVGTVSAYSTPESIVASGKVYVSNVTYDPGAMYD